MFSSIEHFDKTWSQEMKFTQGVMDALTDASLSKSVADDHRTLGRMAWHIITSIPEMATQTELNLEGPDPKAPVPATADEIRQAYRQVSESLLNTVDLGSRNEGSGVIPNTRVIKSASLSG